MQGRSEATQDAQRQLLCVWQSDTGFGASPAFWYYIVCSGATQRGLLQVWRLWMFQLSEFPDKLVSGTQWRVSFIRVQFNFTLSYITLSPRGRISHPILHFESESELCPQTTQLVSSSSFFFYFFLSPPPLPAYLLFVSMDFENKYRSSLVLSLGRNLGKKRESVAWKTQLENFLQRMYKLELGSKNWHWRLLSNLETHRLYFVMDKIKFMRGSVLLTLTPTYTQAMIHMPSYFKMAKFAIINPCHQSSPHADCRPADPHQPPFGKLTIFCYSCLLSFYPLNLLHPSSLRLHWSQPF